MQFVRGYELWEQFKANFHGDPKMQFVRGYELYDYVSQYHPNT